MNVKITWELVLGSGNTHLVNAQGTSPMELATMLMMGICTTMMETEKPLVLPAQKEITWVVG